MRNGAQDVHGVYASLCFGSMPSSKTLDVLSMVRSVKNDLAPINRVPIDAFSLTPDHWYSYDLD